MNNTNNIPLKNNKKTKRKFNFIDFLILLLILTVLVVAVFTIASWSSIEKLLTSSQVSLQYTVELRGVDAEFMNNIKTGDTVTDSVSKTELGSVTRVDIDNHSILDYKEENGVYTGVPA